MKPPTKRQQRARARREQLLDAALEVFAERGYGHATIRDLATAAGVSAGLFYHYFDGKEALLRALVAERSFLPEVRGILAVAGERPAGEVLYEVVERFAALLRKRTPLVRLLVQEAAIRPEVHDIWVRTVNEGTGLLAAYLQQRVEAGELRPHNAGVTARILMAPVLLSQLTAPPPGPWLEDLVEQILGGIRRAGADE